MLMDEYVAESIMKDRTRAWVERSEQGRLLRSAEGRGTGQARWLSATLTLGSLLGLMVARLR